MFPPYELGMMKRRDAIRITIAPDGRSYWAWAKTDSDFCFAVAGVEGELTTAYYADVDPPGPYGVDPRWVPAVDQPPDWDGE